MLLNQKLTIKVKKNGEKFKSNDPKRDQSFNNIKMVNKWSLSNRESTFRFG